MKVSVVVPVFNEAGTIEEVVRRLAGLGLELEVILVDDASGDGTWAAVKRAQACHACVGRVLRHPTNRGKGAAVRTGFAAASGDLVVIQDADLELDPEQIRDLVEPIAAGRAEVVYGSRFLHGRRGPWTSYAANRFLTWLTNRLFGLGITDMETCYKAFRASLLPRLRLTAERFEIEPELTAEFARLGLRIHEVPVRYRPRARHQGKKIRAWDGVIAIRMLLRKWRERRSGPIAPSGPPPAGS